MEPCLNNFLSAASESQVPAIDYPSQLVLTECQTPVAELLGCTVCWERVDEKKFLRNFKSIDKGLSARAEAEWLMEFTSRLALDLP